MKTMAAPDTDPLLLERRQVLKLMAAAAALGSGACSGPPTESIVPFVNMPERSLPGRPQFYATCTALSGYGSGVLVESNEGRPTKVEGNPLHPATLGATDIFSQAAPLQLWDPARSQAVLHDNEISTWPRFLQDIEQELQAFDRNQGEGLFILTGNVTSDTLYRQIQSLRERYPRARWHQYDPLNRDTELQGSQMAFGRPVDTLYHLDRTRVLVTLDADLLSGSPASVRHARDLIATRNPDRGPMSRIYAVESFPGLIGALADHRAALSPAQIERAAVELAQAIGILPHDSSEARSPFIASASADLLAAGGDALVVAGSSLSAHVHALVHAINHRLGARGRTFDHIDPVAHEPVAHADSIRSLAGAMAAGEVHSLIIIGGNPVYDAPVDLDFCGLLGQVPHSVHLSAYVDETSTCCRWHVPATHEFEHWSDIRAFDGTASIVQPLIAPLYHGRSPHDLLNALLRSSASGHDTVRDTWRARIVDDDAWRRVLRQGVIDATASAPLEVVARTPQLPRVTTRPELQIQFVADQSVRDGQFANNAWLQELPRSMSKLTWDNAVYLSPRTAAVLRVAAGDVIELRQEGRSLRAPVWILPNHADHCLTLPLGYGRTRAGPVGDGVGFDAYRLRRSGAFWHDRIEIARTGARHEFASTQNHARMQGRDIIRSATLKDFRGNPQFAVDSERKRVPDVSLYPEHAYDGYKWGMAIDLNACIGCNACTIACQAENNIPVVGKQEVIRGREMHWIRVDRYFQDDGEADAAFQPVPCMHCEHAPCEEVCPVGATVHDSQGLNLQVYNRCVGTRFCSNNCPYKVRRFNFLQYSNQSDEKLAALANPEVTVRERGVMEKCTYCIQRIQRARIQAEQLGRPVRDGEVVTACQAVCPTQAISFGNLNDRTAQVNEFKASPRNYSLLAELNTRPRTTYLARVTNPRTEEE
jgi:molybdopterin-containing oxidoreductase family iron-sulfur binding subunit